ncbi:cell wall-associated NlpC family hydrolase [Rhizobium skierniewicense]|uniref:Cell wall-associated NlpC family hydrolase n=1 Tax=Rhizobium skierniewicense TaxID=984260 RepID=A0A7W6G240_9HYPH|nr:NlpC/P60 family protein [Rhizobium skierniewicense]MBB3946683.1 cell wall-associated NlpC family hydrolase [Rhizobium skierniewicense]
MTLVETTLDRRLNVFREDLADERLKGQVQAARFVSGTPAQVTVPVIGLRPKPDLATGIDTELLMGETVRVFERADGWAWVQADADSYAGYLPETAIGEIVTATHRIIVPRTFLYPQAELRKPPVAPLSMGSRVTFVGEAETRGTRYLVTDKGEAVIASHCVEVGTAVEDDYVSVALRFLETPYLWGGRSGFGIDCSGLVQLSMAMTGKSVLRDTDMQVHSLGHEITREALQRGDLVFWKGHVGLMEDADTLLHANGHTMTVSRENLTEAIERIGWLYERPTAFRRP